MCHIIYGTWCWPCSSRFLLTFHQLTTSLWPLLPLCNILQQAGVRGGCRASCSEHLFNASPLHSAWQQAGMGGHGCSMPFLPAWWELGYPEGMTEACRVLSIMEQPVWNVLGLQMRGCWKNNDSSLGMSCRTKAC